MHPAVKIGQVAPFGLGLVAADEITQGSDIIALPPHLPLRFELDSGDGSNSILTSLAQRVPEELWAMRLGLKLLQERAKSGSFWWPYISNLPETYNVPIFFQGEDIKNLQYAPLLYQVNKRCRFLLDFENEVKQTVENLKLGEHPFDCQDVTAASLGWGMSAVSSRAFRLHVDKLPDGTSKDTPMMLPLIDMCNHSFSPNAKIIQNQYAERPEMLLKVVAEKQISRDDPLLLNYGCLSNDFFLLDYGFVIAANPYDCVELKYDPALLDAASMAAGISSPNFSSPAPWQQEILSQLQLEGDSSSLKVSLGGPELVEGRLLAALRVLLASDKEIVHKQGLSALQSLSDEAPLGVSNETAALRTVIALCVIALEHFSTKIAEDEDIVKRAESSYTELAVRYRIEKKSMIVNMMRRLSRRIKQLQSGESVVA